MHKSTTLAGLAAVLLLAGCLGDNDVGRAAIGAGAGALVGLAIDDDPATIIAGAAVGGVAGALCDDVGVCN